MQVVLPLPESLQGVVDRVRKEGVGSTTHLIVNNRFNSRETGALQYVYSGRRVVFFRRAPRRTPGEFTHVFIINIYKYNDEDI